MTFKVLAFFETATKNVLKNIPIIFKVDWVNHVNTQTYTVVIRTSVTYTCKSGNEVITLKCYY
jgi:hypothetical protein